MTRTVQNQQRVPNLIFLPAGSIDPKPTYHTVEMFRALDRGDIRFMWIQVTNPMVTMPKLKRYRDGSLKEDRFIVVSDVYPTPTTDVADVILPAAVYTSNNIVHVRWNVGGLLHLELLRCQLLQLGEELGRL